MGVEYCHYLIPRPNSFQPDAQQLAYLVEALDGEGWIAVPGTDPLCKIAEIDGMSVQDAAETWAEIRNSDGSDAVPYPLTPAWFRQQLSSDAKLIFPVNHGTDAGLNYPLINHAGPPNDPYYEFQLHWSNDYVHHVSELIDPIEAVCNCGQPLESDDGTDDEVFFTSRIRTLCPACGSTFDPSPLPVVVRDGWTAESSVVKGGAVYRFAVVIDCGKCIPERVRTPIQAHPKLVGLCREACGCDFYEVGDMY